jgi:hypothetical protein
MAHPVGTAVSAPRPQSATLADFALPAALLLAVLVVLAPVPPPLVDLLLAANLTVSVLALLGALAARTPLEMSVFPTFLLGASCGSCSTSPRLGSSSHGPPSRDRRPRAAWSRRSGSSWPPTT